MYKMSRKKSQSTPKPKSKSVKRQRVKKESKPQVDEYIAKTHSEINNKLVSTFNGVIPEISVITIDDDIKPVLLVLSNDVCGGNHEQGVDNAVIFKCCNFAVKAMREGSISPTSGFDLTGMIGIMHHAILMMPSVANTIGSFMECFGKNIKQGSEDTIFQYGLAMFTGANLTSSDKSPQLQLIGISIGKIIEGTNKKENQVLVKPLVKNLPNNKYRKRLEELVDKLCIEAPSEEAVVPDTLSPDDTNATDTPSESSSEVKFITGDEEQEHKQE